jgi:hypothetical protein
VITASIKLTWNSLWQLYILTLSDSDQPRPATNDKTKEPRAPAPEKLARLKPNNERRPRLNSRTNLFFWDALFYSGIMCRISSDGDSGSHSDGHYIVMVIT